MSKIIEKIVSQALPPKDTNVGWWNGKELKFYTNGKWKISGGDTDYKRLERELKYSSITIFGDEGQDCFDFAGKYDGMSFEDFMKEKLQVEYGNGIRDSITVRLFLEDLHWYRNCRLLLSGRGNYLGLNLSYYYTDGKDNDTYDCNLIFGVTNNDIGIEITIQATFGEPVYANAVEI